MSRKRGKRSSEQGTVSRCPVTQDMFGGVGGRQASPRPPHKGGGYQNKCTVLNFDQNAAEKKRDPRLDELREMGLQRHWMLIAEEIGVDEFLKMWRILDREAHTYDRGYGRILVPIRLYSVYLKYQRNRYIESLLREGMKPKDVVEKVHRQLGDKVCMSNILRIRKSI